MGFHPACTNGFKFLGWTANRLFGDSKPTFWGQQTDFLGTANRLFNLFVFLLFRLILNFWNSLSDSSFDGDEKKKKGALYSEKVSRNLLAFRSELFRVQNLKTCKLRNSDFSSSLFHLRRNDYGDEKKKKKEL